MHILKYTAFEFYFTPIESKYLQTFGAFLAHWQTSAYTHVSLHPKHSEFVRKNGYK